MAPFAQDVGTIAGVLLLIAGASAAWASGNLAKRLVGLAMAHLGAVLSAASVGAPHSLLMAGAALGFAALAIGAAIVVRLQEAHGAIEAAVVDGADRDADARETAT